MPPRIGSPVKIQIASTLHLHASKNMKEEWIRKMPHTFFLKELRNKPINARWSNDVSNKIGNL